MDKIKDKLSLINGNNSKAKQYLKKRHNQFNEKEKGNKR
jgi:hypothetical protein